MSSSLTPYSVHRIIYFVENDNRTGQVTETLDWRVNRTWSSVYHDFSVLFGALRVPADYVRSLEYALHLQDGSDNAARLLRNVFRNGTPLVIDQCLPPLIVPKIIEVSGTTVKSHNHYKLKELPQFSMTQEVPKELSTTRPLKNSPLL